MINFIMGLSFITEGAILSAASDPLHVSQDCVIESETSNFIDDKGMAEL